MAVNIPRVWLLRVTTRGSLPASHDLESFIALTNDAMKRYLYPEGPVIGMAVIMTATSMLLSGTARHRQVRLKTWGTELGIEKGPVKFVIH